MSHCCCRRASTEREPTKTDLVFAVVFLTVVVGCFVMVWNGIAFEFFRAFMQRLGAIYMLYR